MLGNTVSSHGTLSRRILLKSYLICRFKHLNLFKGSFGTSAGNQLIARNLSEALMQLAYILRSFPHGVFWIFQARKQPWLKSQLRSDFDTQISSCLQSSRPLIRVRACEILEFTTGRQVTMEEHQLHVEVKIWGTNMRGLRASVHVSMNSLMFTTEKL